MLPKGTRVPTGDLQENEAVSGKKYMSGGTFEQKTGTLPDYKGTSPFHVPYTGGIPGQIRIQLPTGRFVENNPSEQVFITDANYTAENIAAGKQVFDLPGTFTADADATPEDVVAGKVFYANGERKVGTRTT